MRKFITTTCFCMLFWCADAQQYHFSYQGILSPTQQENIEQKLSMNSSITKVKFQQKEEAGVGEIFIYFNAEGAGEEAILFDPKVVKSLLIENNIELTNFQEITR